MFYTVPHMTAVRRFERSRRAYARATDALTRAFDNGTVDHAEYSARYARLASLLSLHLHRFDR